MKFLNRNITDETRWETYKKLELIPNSVTNPEANKLIFTFGLEQVWRLLIVALTQELVDEQRIEYLERCWALNNFETDSKTGSNTLHKLWTLMD